MRFVSVTVVAALLTLGSVGSAFAQGKSFTGLSYSAKDLLNVCTEADNDSRLLGAAAEVECEQYILGFVDALAVVEAAGSGTDMCPPIVNTADEVRWAYMRWVHGAFSTRKVMSAADALLATLKDRFPCP